MVDAACINLEILGRDVGSGDTVVSGATHYLKETKLDVGEVNGSDLGEG